jgi:hypothetical protein
MKAEMERRIAVYSVRAEAGLPLFEHAGSLDAAPSGPA